MTTTRDRRGFTLVELLTALVLFGIVGTALYQLLVNNQRVYQRQKGQIEATQHARAAAFLMPMELRELNPGDPAGSDIVSMSATQIAYKAMRSLYVLCQDPIVAGLQLVLDGTNVYGLRALNAGRDSILVFAEADPTTRMDDYWVHGNVTAVVQGTACPGGRPSLAITLADLTGALTDVTNGAPVRGFEVVEVQLYQVGTDWWMGGRTWDKAASAWTALARIVGPLTAGGLQLTYYDNAGAVTANPANVARIAVNVVGQSVLPVRGAYLQEDLVTTASVRNNPTY